MGERPEGGAGKARPRLGEGEVGRVLERLKRDARRPEAQLLLLMMLAGATREEANFARWENFDAAGKTLLATGREGHAPGRLIYLSSSAASLIESARRLTTSPWLFPSKARPSKPLAEKAVRRYFGEMMDSLGLPGHVVDDLRDTYADFLLKRHVPPTTVRQLMGEAS